MTSKYKKYIQWVHNYRDNILKAIYKARVILGMYRFSIYGTYQ